MRRITTIILAATLMAMPSYSFAQTDEPKKEDNAAREAAERRVRWSLRRLTSRLELSDAQAEKVKAILMATELKQSTMRDAQAKEIGELLTPDQQEKYKELRDRMRNRRGGGRGRGGGGGGGMGRMMGLDLDQIKKRLGLNDEQAKKIQSIITEATEKGREEFSKMRQGGGGFDMSKMRGLVEKLRDDVRGKINKQLDEEQLKKFDALNKEVDERMNQWMSRMGMGRRGGSRENRGGNRGPRRARTPEQTTQRRLSAVMSSLKLPDEEAAVLSELIKKVISYQATTSSKARTMRDEIRKLATGGGDEDAIKQKVEHLRKLRTASRTKLDSLREGLTELLTPTQEAVLVSHGVLN